MPYNNLMLVYALNSLIKKTIYMLLYFQIKEREIYQNLDVHGFYSVNMIIY